MPSLRRLPVFKLLAVGEVLLLAREHMRRLEPDERRRLMELVRHTRGRPGSLSQRERDELTALIDKAQPRLFLTNAADKFSPVPIPGRFRRARR